MTSESEGEVEVASPAGQEGGKLSDDQLNWLMTNMRGCSQMTSSPEGEGGGKPKDDE